MPESCYGQTTSKPRSAKTHPIRDQAAIKIAIIGAGMYSPITFRSVIQFQTEGKVEFVAFASRTPETVVKRSEQYGVKGYTDWKKMLDENDIDAVIIATPDHLHTEMSIYAAQTGRHILVEKPMDTTVGGACRMASSAERSGVLLQVDMHKRFDVYHQRCRTAVASGKLGAVQYGYAWAEQKISMPRDNFCAWAQHTTPAWLVGTHFVDLFLWLTGQKAISAYSTGQKGKLAELGYDTYDSIQSIIACEGGASFTIHSSWILPDRFEGAMNQGIRIVGSEGMMEIDSQDRGMESCFACDGMATYNMGFWAQRIGRGGEPEYSGYALESIRSFVDNVRFLQTCGDIDALRGMYPTAEEGLEVTAVIAACHDSLVVKRPVEIADISDWRSRYENL